MTTPPRQAAVWRSGQPLRFISTRSLVHPFAANAAFPLKGKQEDCAAALAPLKTVRSQSTAEPPRAEERAGMGQRFWALMKRRAERSPATLGRATFRSEISPLRFAAVEMTGGGVISVLFMHFFTAPFWGSPCGKRAVTAFSPGDCLFLPYQTLGLVYSSCFA